MSDVKMYFKIMFLFIFRQEIEKIENIDMCCRRLKILLLQHNVIGKMENLNKMKDLEYLYFDF